MKITDIHLPIGAHRRRKRLGRGESSGHGKTSTRGTKGQRARTGSSARPGFEGGQMPLYLRIPKRGFTSRRKKVFNVVNVGELNKFDDNTVVDLSTTMHGHVKVLADGELNKPLTIKAYAFSKSAMRKIEKVGGKAEVAVKS